LPYTQAIIDGITPGVPVINFATGNPALLPLLTEAGGDVIGIDWTCDARAARKLASGRVALQGNLDPAALFSPEKALRAAARGVLDAFGPQPGHIFNLGHGISPTTPPAAVAALVDEVRAYSSARPKTRKPS